MAARKVQAIKLHGRRRAWGRVAAVGLFCAANLFARQSRAQDKLPTIVVHATKRAYHNCLVTVAIPALKRPASVFGRINMFTISYDKQPVNTIIMRRQAIEMIQTFEKDGQTYASFWIDDLPQGATREYHINESLGMNGHPIQSVIVKPHGEDMEIRVGYDRPEDLFTRYITHGGPNKPFFYPILTPGGQNMTRTWPLDANSTESHDHPHHRGLWFTHSDLNGIDFWTEQNTDKAQVGKTIAMGFENVEHGIVFGTFRTRTEWRAPDGKLIATDTRDVRVYPIDLNRAQSTDRIMDFEITVKPNGEPLKWGDNKDGTFGLRLPDTLAPAPEKSAHIATPTGHIETSSGLKDGAAWGQPADWVDYYGLVGGKTWGVAILDNPQNLRHPTTWHARDYGLFAANPFGLHDFKRGDKGAGDYIQPADKPLTFRYRLLFHAGDTTSAHVAEQYANYADPPEVTVK